MEIVNYCVAFNKNADYEGGQSYHTLLMIGNQTGGKFGGVIGLEPEQKPGATVLKQSEQ